MKKFVSVMIFCFMMTTLLFGQNIPKSVYVVNSVANTLSYINLETGNVALDTLSPGASSSPNFLRIHQGKGYLVNSGTNNVMVFNLENLELDRFIPLPTGSNPWALDFINDSLFAVTFFQSDEVAIVNIHTDAIVQTIPVGTSPEGIVYANGYIYIANSGFVSFGQPYDPGTVSVVDAATFQVVDTIAVGLNPQDLAVDSQGRLVVACTGDWGATAAGEVDVIELQSNSILWSKTVNSFISGVKVNSQNKAYLATFGSGVLVLDLETQTFEIDETNPLTGGPGVAFDADDNAYICEFGDGTNAGTLRVFNSSHQLQQSYTVNVGPVFVAIYDPAFSGFEYSTPKITENFQLEANYPNPFNPETRIPFRIQKSGYTKLEIFNILGKPIKTLVNENLVPGNYEVVWDGTNALNQQVASGIYFYRLVQNNQVQIKKMELLR
ncbi:MAG: hypothetical protein Kow0037_03020 [Calditrichia bacterium]